MPPATTAATARSWISGAAVSDELPPRPHPLTRREREILRLLADGLRIAEIGKQLYLSPDTIKVHLTKARRKLGARTTAEAVATAVRRSLIV